MTQNVDTHPEFEAIAQEFLADHHELRHEWRRIRGVFPDSRTDLICEPGSDREVFATLRSGQIAVGAGGDHTDFESFGRDMADTEVAQEAFAYFVELLKRNGLITERGRPKS